jgi:hypothetical protein
MNVTNVSQLISWMSDTGQFSALANSPLSQFGTPQERLLGASILPEQQEMENSFKDSGIAIDGEIGQSGADLSPAQLNKAFGEYSSLFVLGKIDAATQLNGADIEKIIQYLMRTRPSNTPVESSAEIVTRWFDRGVMGSLAKLIEHQRWQAIVDGVVKRRGANGYSEDVTYPFPSGHQVTVAASGTVAAPAGWYDRAAATAADALEDILAAKERLMLKGFTLNRIISKSAIKTVFMRNGKVRQSALPQGATRSTSQSDIDAMLSSYGLPGWETYDITFPYRNPNNTNILTRTGYLDRTGFDPVILLASTSLEAQIDMGRDNGILTLPNTLGVYALGRPEGQTQYGKVAKAIVYDEKYPPSVYGEVVAKGLPIINTQVMEGIVILKIPKPTP